MAWSRIGFLVFCLAFFAGNATAQKSFKLKNGDLLFQDLDCGGLCDAIEKVTTGYRNATFSHVGLVKIAEDGNVLVLEAIGQDVHYTPLDKFLNRQLDADKKPKVAVGRLRGQYQHLVPTALKEADKYLGKPYDDFFALNNEAYYCSELVYFLFKDANQQQPLFDLNPMTYAEPGSGQIMPVWDTYFKELQAAVPENDPGLNPGGISRSKKLKMYFPYGTPGKNKRGKN